VQSLCKRASGSACRLCPSCVQVRPVFLPPSSATLFLYLWSSIGGMFLQKETAQEEEASLERMDVAEERVGLYGDAIKQVVNKAPA
jgi:hypothetical protein